MRCVLFALTAAAALAFVTTPAQAGPTLLVNGSGQLIGATGVNVGGTLYDVTFSTGSCIDAYNGCDPAAFTFANAADAQAAAQALFDQLFIDGPAGQFDSVPTLTSNCWYPDFCRAAVPYGVGLNVLYGPAVLSYVAQNATTDSNDVVLNFSDLQNYNATSGDAQIWTHFAVEGVPEPATWAMMLLGFGGIGFVMRRGRGNLALPQID